MDETKDGIIRYTIFFKYTYTISREHSTITKYLLSPILETIFFSAVTFPHFYTYYVSCRIIYFFLVLYFSHIIQELYILSPIMHFFFVLPSKYGIRSVFQKIHTWTKVWAPQQLSNTETAVLEKKTSFLIKANRLLVHPKRFLL